MRAERQTRPRRQRTWRLAMYLKTLILEYFTTPKPVRDRAGGELTPIVRLDEIVPKLRRPERETATDR